MNNTNHFMIIIYGPTAVGKTDFANTLANYIPIEIINIDVGQLYVPLSIGTAKPDFTKTTIPHHLFNCINTPRDYTVVEYREQLIATVQHIWKRGNTPVLVGGSGFYIRSLFFPPTVGTIKKDLNTKSEISWEQLHTIDPQRASTINKHDYYRIARALSIWYTTGQLPSHYKPSYSPLSPFVMLWLIRERQELYARINERVVHMIKQGWIDEVRQLMGTPWELFMQKKRIIGYNDIITYMHHEEHNLHHLITNIQQKTRNYAKRQITFWHKLEAELHQAIREMHTCALLESVNLTFTDVDLYIKQLLSKISSKIL